MYTVKMGEITVGSVIFMQIYIILVDLESPDMNSTFLSGDLSL